MITKISDGKLFVEINSKGAELWRVYDKEGKDYLWEGNSEFWGRRAPTLFPICGGMIDDSYTYNGTRYSMPKHGFCRDAEFVLESATKSRAVYLIQSNEGRKALFPFDFEFRIIYTVKGAALTVEYKVNNRGENTMYFSVGSHEAYACPEGIEGYSIEFEKPEYLQSLVIEDSLIQVDKTVIGEDITSLPMDYRYFTVDALCFKNLLSKRVSLVGHGRRVDVEFEGFEYVLIWTKPNAPFLCIELNCGIDDYVGHNGRIEEKEGIISLEKGKEFCRSHTMRFSAV